MIKTVDLKKKIRTKFKNVSRFSTISGVPYHFIQNAFKKENEMHLRRIEKAVEETADKPIFDEVSQDIIDAVKLALKKKDLGDWCRDNGVNQWWLRQFLDGEVRFKTHHRVKRLLALLDIK